MIARIIAAVLLTLGVASSASAECAWVRWTRMELGKERLDWEPGVVFPNYTACRTAIGKTMSLDEPGSMRDWWLWITRQGRMTPSGHKPGALSSSVQFGPRMER